MATYIKEDAAPQVTYLADGTEVHRTSPWSPPGCHGMGCGVRAFVKDGKCIKIEGDPDHPTTKGRLCVRCLRVLDLIYSPDRIVHPMYRDPKDRGTDKWERVTWDWAYDKIEEEINKCKEKYGPNSLTVLTGTGREAGRYMTNTSARICVTTNQCYTQTGFSCMAPRDTVCSMIGGAGYIEYDFANGLPGRYDDPEYVQPKYLLNWGRDSLRSNPDGTWGHSMIELFKRGTKLINVDPRVNWLSTRALYYMQLRPNTDTALAFGLLWVLINEDLYDHDFVDKWCYGFDEFKERVNQYPLDWAAEVTEVPAETIRAVAHCLAEKPWGLNMGLANDQNPNGVQSVHCLYALCAITGNLDIPGGTNIGWNITLDFGGQSYDGNGEKSSANQKRETVPPNPVTQEQRDSTIGLEMYPIYKLLLGKSVPDEFLPTLETDEPYPIRFCWILHTNPVAPTNSAAPQRWHKALKRMDFVVAQDIFMNPTIASCCDLFLPLATWLEHDGYITQLMGEHPGPVAAMVKSIPAVGECKSEFEIIHDMAQRPQFRDNFYVDGESKVDSIERYISEDLTKVVLFGHDWEYLKDHVQVMRKTEYRKYERGMLRPDGQPGFNTTTGKIELYSLMFAACGGDPLPYYEEPVFGPTWNENTADEMHDCAANRVVAEYTKEHPGWKKDYPLTVTTGARNWASFHSEHRQSKMLREIKPYPVVAMNPELAKELSIVEGDWVCIENPWGHCYEKAKITPIVKKNVVMADHGWWYPEEDMNEPNIGGVWKSNINTLIPNNVVGHYGFGAPMKCMIGRIVKCDKPPIEERDMKDLSSLQNYPGCLKNDPELQWLMAE